MSRRNAATIRPSTPDAVYKSRLVTQLINKVLLDGKKALAERVVYDALQKVEAISDGDALSVFQTAMENIKPAVEVRPRRVGGATYQVPMEVPARRSTTLGIRWLVDFSRKRKEKTMTERLAAEILDAAQNSGAAVKKREDTFKMAESNRAFAHYRF